MGIISVVAADMNMRFNQVQQLQMYTPLESDVSHC